MHVLYRYRACYILKIYELTAIHVHFKNRQQYTQNPKCNPASSSEFFRTDLEAISCWSFSGRLTKLTSSKMFQPHWLGSLRKDSNIYIIVSDTIYFIWLNKNTYKLVLQTATFIVIRHFNTDSGIRFMSPFVLLLLLNIQG